MKFSVKSIFYEIFKKSINPIRTTKQEKEKITIKTKQEIEHQQFSRKKTIFLQCAAQ